MFKIKIYLFFVFLILLPHLTFAVSFTSVIFPTNGIKYDLYEIVFKTDQVIALAANPYDPAQFNYYAEFWSPSGKYYKVNAFYFNGVDDLGCVATFDPPGSTLNWQIKQTLSLNTITNWKVRFTPNEISTTIQWKCRIVAQDNSGVAYAPSVFGFHSFYCTTSTGSPTNKGFITKANQRYLKFDDGSPFFPVGDNAPFFQHDALKHPGDPNFIEPGTCMVKRQIDEMQNNNENFFVYDINFLYAMSIYGIDFKDGKNYYSFFNQRDSWQMDDIINYAHDKGIYIDLCIFAHSDFGNTSYCKNKWNLYNPFYSQVYFAPSYPDSPGPCLTPFDFLTNQDAIKTQKNLLRYIISRWGYSMNIMSWELLDEVEQFNTFYPTCNPPDLTDKIADWHTLLKAYIKEVDPQNHLVCTGNKERDPNLNAVMNNVMDFVISKQYTNQGPSPISDPNSGGWINVDFEKSNFDLSKAFNAKYFTPFFMIEFGYFTDTYKLLPKYDTTMYGLHGLLWSSLFSGAMGPSCFWAHEDINYHKLNALGNFNGIGKFVKNLPLLSEDFQANFIANTGISGMKMYYLKNNNSDKFYGWVQDLNFDFKTILRSTLPSTGATSWTYQSPPPLYLKDLTTMRPPLSSLSNNIILNVGKNGSFEIQWYNTKTGLLASFITTTASNNNLTISIPSILRNGPYGDAAFIVQYKCDGIWNYTILNSNTPSNSRIDSDLEIGSNGEILFVGNDARVHIMLNNGFYWQEGVLNSSSGIVKPNSDLARGGTNDQINFIGIDNRVHQYYWDNITKQWIQALLCNTQSAVRSNSPLVCDAAGSVYYFAYDNKVHIYYWDNNIHSWQEGSINNSIPVRFDSDIAINTQGDIFYIGTNNSIYRCFWNSTNWSTSILDPLTSTKVKNGSSLTCDVSGNLYYIADEGVNGRIHRFKKSGSMWNEENFAPNTPSNSIKIGSDLTITPNGQIFFIGTDNRIHNYWQSTGSWIEAILNINSLPNASKYLASDLHGNIFYNSDNVMGCGNRINAYYYGCQAKF